MRDFIKAISLGLIFTGLIACNNNETVKEADDPVTETTTKESPLQQLNRKISNDEQNADLYHQRARYFLSEQKINEALGDINKALQLKDNVAEYYITLSDIYLAMGQGIKCEDALEKALNKDPDNIKAILKLGELNFILRDYKDAIKYCNEAIQADNGLSTPYLIKGYTFLETGDTNTAVENFQMAVDKDPENYDAMVQLALVYQEMDDKLAEDYFKNALGVQPNSEEALYGLAMYYQDNMEIEQAIETYEKILSLNPNHILSYYNLGWINLVYLENYEAAKSYFSNAIDLNPEYFNAWYNRGYTNELLKDYNRARVDYKKSLELNPNFDKAIEALNRLDEKQSVR